MDPAKREMLWKTIKENHPDIDFKDNGYGKTTEKGNGIFSS